MISEDRLKELIPELKTTMHSDYHPYLPGSINKQTEQLREVFNALFDIVKRSERKHLGYYGTEAGISPFRSMWANEIKIIEAIAGIPYEEILNKG